MCIGFQETDVVPKVQGANTLDKLWDLELGNEVRKVLACMFLKVLQEFCKQEVHGFCHAQEAFVTGRDIIRITTMLCRNFWAAHEEAVHGDDPYVLLALNCSKGYNRMDHSWLQRCLRERHQPLQRSWRGRKRSSQSAGQYAFKVLDEFCKQEVHGLCHAQQAFVTGRDIIRNTSMLCRNF